MRYLLFLSFSFLAFQSFFPERALAKPLEKDMTINNVIVLWGTPKEKIRYETLREEKWLYQDGRQVRFRQERVKSWLASFKERELEKLKKERKAQEQAKKIKTKSDQSDKKSPEDKDGIFSATSFLQEVSKESTEDSGGSDNSNRGNRRNKRR